MKKHIYLKFSYKVPEIKNYTFCEGRNILKNIGKKVRYNIKYKNGKIFGLTMKLMNLLLPSDIYLFNSF